MNEFNKRTNNSYDMKKFKNHHNKLKDDYKIWDKMMNKYTSFGYDPVTGTVTAESEVWDDFLQVKYYFIYIHVLRLHILFNIVLIYSPISYRPTQRLQSSVPRH